MAINNLDLRFGQSYFDVIGNKECIKFHVDYWNHIRGGVPTLRTRARLDSVIATTSIRVFSKARQHCLKDKTRAYLHSSRPLLSKSRRWVHVVGIRVKKIWIRQTVDEWWVVRKHKFWAVSKHIKIDWYTCCNADFGNNTQTGLDGISVCQILVYCWCK